MTIFQLKLIACITMLIGHTTYLILPKTTSFNVFGIAIGSNSLPLFCFTLVEGFFYTQNLKKYLIRLAVFGLISEAAHDFAFLGFHTDQYLNLQNIYFTLLFGIITIAVLEHLKLKYIPWNIMFYRIIASLVIIVSLLSAVFTRNFYAIIGIPLILVFYYFRNNQKWLVISILICSSYVIIKIPVLVFALISLPIILTYRGEKGRSLKYFFYLFYPAHLALIGLIVHLR